MQVTRGLGWVEANPGVTRLDKRWLSQRAVVAETLLAEDPHDILIDLHEVTMVDSGVPVLLSQLADACVKRGGSLYIARPPALLVNLMKGTNLSGFHYAGDPKLDVEWLAARVRATAWKKGQQV